MLSGKKQEDPVSNLTQGVKSEPRTADKIAEKVGVSRNTYNAPQTHQNTLRPFVTL